MSYGTVYEHIAVEGVGSITICGTDKYVPWSLGVADWLVQTTYAIILLLLASYKAAEYWRLSAGFKGFTLVKVLIEDQIIYFMSVILVSVFAILEFRIQTAAGFASDILAVLANPSFLCILGSRMLLNLKEAGERGQNEGTSFKVPAMRISDIEFGEPPANVEASETNEAEERGQSERTSSVASSGIVDDIEFGESPATAEGKLTGKVPHFGVSHDCLASQTEAATGK